jgi:UDP-glucose 4-epimerase
MGMRFLILGGGGFIGSHLCDALLAQGHVVRLFDRVASALPEPRPTDGGHVEWIRGEFTSTQDIQAAISDVQVVFHLVSTTLPKSSNDDPVFDIETNLIGTVRLLEAARQAGVKKLVFVSSGGTVYGTPRFLPISEDHPTEPISSYGISKLAIEKYLRLYEVLHGLDYSVLRIANPFGERQRAQASQGAVAVFMHRAINNLPIEIWGDGSVVRDYIYIGDVVDALIKAAFHAGEHRLFNIGSGNGKSLNDLLSAIEALVGRPVARTYLAARSFDVPASVLDIGRARAHLQWSPQTSFDAGLARTYRWQDGLAR